MQKYLDRDKDSGISSYQIGVNYIIVKFKAGQLYEYNYTRPGKLHVDKMKILAVQGNGLNSYINKYVGANCYKR